VWGFFEKSITEKGKEFIVKVCINLHCTCHLMDSFFLTSYQEDDTATQSLHTKNLKEQQILNNMNNIEKMIVNDAF